MNSFNRDAKGIRTTWLPSGKPLRILLSCLAVLVWATPKAHAYGDPGSGALLWQMLMASVVGGMFYIRRMINWFRAKAKGSEASQDVVGDD